MGETLQHLKRKGSFSFKLTSAHPLLAVTVCISQQKYAGFHLHLPSTYAVPSRSTKLCHGNISSGAVLSQTGGRAGSSHFHNTETAWLGHCLGLELWAGCSHLSPGCRLCSLSVSSVVCSSLPQSERWVDVARASLLVAVLESVGWKFWAWGGYRVLFFPLHPDMVNWGISLFLPLDLKWISWSSFAFWL